MNRAGAGRFPGGGTLVRREAVRRQAVLAFAGKGRMGRQAGPGLRGRAGQGVGGGLLPGGCRFRKVCAGLLLRAVSGKARCMYGVFFGFPPFSGLCRWRLFQETGGLRPAGNPLERAGGKRGFAGCCGLFCLLYCRVISFSGVLGALSFFPRTGFSRENKAERTGRGSLEGNRRNAA